MNRQKLQLRIMTDSVSTSLTNAKSAGMVLVQKMTKKNKKI